MSNQNNLPPFVQSIQKKRPPALKPRWLHDTQRKYDIADAISRYLEKGNIEIPLEWVTEYNEIVKRNFGDGER